MIRIAVAIFISVVLVGGPALADCPAAHPKPHPTKPSAKTRAQTSPCLDLGAVPQISATVVAAEPAPAAKPPTAPAPVDSPRADGPTVNMLKPDPGVRPVPTIGYHWSLE